MSDEQKNDDRTDFTLAYKAPSTVQSSEEKTEVALYGNLHREQVQFDGQIVDPLRFRELMSALYEIVGSDYRYVPKDRTAYLAYRRMKSESAGLSQWQAQQAYFTWIMRNDPLAALILDPIISVHPDQIFFEVFSKDEGTYAKLAWDRDAFQLKGEPNCGTTNIDYSQSLFNGIQQMRSYRETLLSIGRESVSVQTEAVGESMEKQIRVPDSWLRGFLQVQSSATLPRDTFTMSPMDFYNVLRQLRLNADQKGQRRGLRVELIPGEQPRLVLEPWEIVIPCSASPFQGRAAKIIRVWGRRRLMLVRRLLPYLKDVEVHLLGSGLPSFWIFRGDGFTLTIGLTGFTASNWSQAVTFDLLLPRKTETAKPVEIVLEHLKKVWICDRNGLSEATGLKHDELNEAIQVGCQQGKMMYDIAQDTFRYRPVTETPLDLERLEYRNQRERTAHDLLVRRGAVKILSVNRIAGSGLEITGEVNVTEDKREYRPQLLLSEEGQVRRAECTCTYFRKQGLTGGPCAHLIALRLAQAQEERRRLEGKEPRETITVETRTYSKRDDRGEDIYQISLDQHQLKVHWGRMGQVMRKQLLKFNTTEEARSAYFKRIDALESRGYLDATAG